MATPNSLGIIQLRKFTQETGHPLATPEARPLCETHISPFLSIVMRMDYSLLPLNLTIISEDHKGLVIVFPYQFPIARQVQCFFCLNSVVSRNSFTPDRVFQKINTVIEVNYNSPQALWTSLRKLINSYAKNINFGLLHDVINFCLAVFDTLEPNASYEERNQRITYVDKLAISLNLQIGELFKIFGEKDNAFLVKWGIIITCVNMLENRKRVKDFMSVFSAFDSFANDLQQVEHEEQVASAWLYSLYSAVFTLAHGTIPAGVLGIASFGIGLSVHK